MARYFQSCRRLLAVILSVVGCLVCASGCQAKAIEVTQSAYPEYEFDIWGANIGMVGSSNGMSQDSFSCLGISDAQFKAVLEPGEYQVFMFSPGCSGLQLWVGDYELEFNVRGAATVGQPLATVPVGGAPYLPYAFYRFPDSMGQGGAVWQDGVDGAVASPSPSDPLLVWLSFGGGSLGHDNSVAVTLLAPIDKQPFFKVDPVLAMTQLVEWSARGLAAENPGWAPASFPATNPSPYVPPADGSVPTATTTLPPLPSLDGTPGVSAAP